MHLHLKYLSMACLNGEIDTVVIKHHFDTYLIVNHYWRFRSYIPIYVLELALLEIAKTFQIIIFPLFIFCYQ